MLVLPAGFMLAPLQSLAAEQTECKLSPKVEQELQYLSQTITEQDNLIKNQCSETVKKSSVSSMYLKFQSIGVSPRSFFGSTSIWKSSMSNQNLSYDLKAYKKKIDELNELGKKAYEACDSAALISLTVQKQRYYAGDGADATTTPKILGLELLYQADKKQIDGQDNPWYQAGYYLPQSPHRCMESSFGFQNVSSKSFKTAWKNFISSIKSLVNHEKNLAQEVQKDLEKFKKDFQSSFKSMIAKMKNKEDAIDNQNAQISKEIENEQIIPPVKTLQKLREELAAKGGTSITQSQLSAEYERAQKLRDQKKLVSAQHAQARLLYNNAAGTYNVILEKEIEKMGVLVKSQLCPSVKKTAELTALFCSQIVKNKPGICDEVKYKNQSCE